MASDEPHILVRESPRAVQTALRFASRPVVGPNCRAAVAAWRDAHNRHLPPDRLKGEGKVACAVFSEQLLAEYTAHRARHADWVPLAPPSGLRELYVVPQDDGIAASADANVDDEGGDATDVRRPLPGASAGMYVLQPALCYRELAFVAEGDILRATLPDEVFAAADASADASAQRRPRHTSGSRVCSVHVEWRLLAPSLLAGRPTSSI